MEGITIFKNPGANSFKKGIICQQIISFNFSLVKKIFSLVCFPKEIPIYIAPPKNH